MVSLTKTQKNFLSMPSVPGAIRVLEQTGKVKSLNRDKGRSAKLPGKRISKTGKVYWETRKNRSDAPLKAV